MDLAHIVWIVGLQFRKSITGMQSKKGMPTQQNINDLYNWCTIDGELDLRLLGVITGMQNGKGMPAQQDITDFKNLCVIDGKLDLELLRSLMRMQKNNEIAPQENLESFESFQYLGTVDEALDTELQNPIPEMDIDEEALLNDIDLFLDEMFFMDPENANDDDNENRRKRRRILDPEPTFNAFQAPIGT